MKTLPVPGLATMPQEVAFDEERHIYTTAGGAILPGITSTLKAAGILYEVEDSQFIDPTKGQAIHQAVHFDCENDLDEELMRERTPDLMGYIEAARSARRNEGIEVKKAEWAITDSAGALGYATKVDAYALWRGKPTVINWKTSVKKYRFYAVQMALEALLFSPEHVERLGVHLRADGSYRLEHYTDRRDFIVAKAALTCRHWIKEGEKR